jgi:hypothetical protein
MVAVLPVLGKPTTSIEPADGALDEPALGFDDEPFDIVAPSDNLDLQRGHDVGDASQEDRPRISAVGEQLAQERKLPEQGRQKQHAAVAVLDVGGSDQRVQQQAEFVDQNVALLAFDQLAGVKAMRINGRPPFSALLTLWLSMMQPVGLISRSASSRHFTYSA